MRNFEYVSPRNIFKTYTGIVAYIVFARDHVRKHLELFSFWCKYHWKKRKLRRNLKVVEKLLSKVDNVVNIGDLGE